jgi:hypothetical protein
MTEPEPEKRWRQLELKKYCEANGLDYVLMEMVTRTAANKMAWEIMGVQNYKPPKGAIFESSNTKTEEE